MIKRLFIYLGFAAALASPARLQELERDVDYLLFEDEGHGFTKASNMHKAMRASAYWLFKHLQ